MSRAETPCPPAHPLYGNLNESQQLSCWRSKGTEDWVLMYTCAGLCRFNYTDKSIDLQTGSWVLIKPNHRHDYFLPGENNEGHWQVLWCVFKSKPDWAPLLNWDNLAKGYGHFQSEKNDNQKSAINHLHQAVQLAKADWPGAKDLARNQLEACLLWLQTINPHAQQQEWDERIRHACDIWTQDHERPFNLEAMANEQQLSVPQFCRLFKRHTGLSPQRYIEQHRLEHASQLLSHTGLSITDIATRCGFDDPFYFSTRFRKQFQCSPRAYRNGQQA